MITTWKDDEDIEPGKLVCYNGIYSVVIEVSEEEVILINPHDKRQFRTKVSTETISRPAIEPWADQMAAFINKARDFSHLLVREEEEVVAEE